MRALSTSLTSALVLSSLCATSLAPAAQNALPEGPVRSRLVPLPLHAAFQLWADAGGRVRIVGRDASLAGVLVRLDRGGALRSIPLGGEAVGISSDGTAIAGFAPTPNALYFEGAWWEAGHPVTLHVLGGDIRSFAAMENTPSGLVLVGGDAGFPFDARPGGGPGGRLPGLLGFPTDGAANGVSLDGTIYSGYVGSPYSSYMHAVRWVNRQVFALDESGATMSAAHGLTPDGASFAGTAFVAGVWRPVAWLGSDALRALVDFDGAPFSGQANGILADGLVYGTGTRAGQGFGWVWHPSAGSLAVTRFEGWFAELGGRPPWVRITDVRDIHPTPHSYHCSLMAGAQGWYAEVPRP